MRRETLDGRDFFFKWAIHSRREIRCIAGSGRCGAAVVNAKQIARVTARQK